MPILEARIELFDQMGDSIKRSGQVRCELFAAVGRDGRDAGPLLYKWDITLHTLEDQQRYFDPITRGYVFRLRIDNPELIRRPTLLSVVFQPESGDRLSTRGRVQTQW